MCIVDEAGRYVDCALADGSGELQYIRMWTPPDAMG